MSLEDEDMECDSPTNVPTTANHVTPSRTQSKYNGTYQLFRKWNKVNGCFPVSENLLMKYFVELAEKSKPPTLFAIYSGLKTTFRKNDEIDISGYSKLLEYLRERKLGYKSVKSKVFTDDEIEKFLKEAPDARWLHIKVICIFGVSGANTSKKLNNVMVEHVKQYDDMMLVTIARTEKSPQSTFTITGSYFSIVQQYADLRPGNVITNNFFMNYNDGKCTPQNISKNKFNAMARKMAAYLKLTEPARYSVLSFRRNSPNLYGSSNAWNMTPAADERITERVQLDYQTGLLKTPRFNYPRPHVATLPAPRSSTTNYNKNDTRTGHVCTLSCGQVKCASEENEGSVLHAFAAMKPSGYVITDVTPAVYPSEPACQWIVGYTHRMDAVTAYNADDTFKEITRAIPNNVRINQKYIRGDSSQLRAAYVIVYSVTCKCQKNTTDINNFFSE